jgi:hypothetical protein
VPRAVPRRLPFRRSDPAPLVEVVEDLSRLGRGWVNIAADLGDGDAARKAPNQPGGWFSARGPESPHSTYVPPRQKRNGRFEPAQLGIEHAAGPRAVRQLDAAGLTVPGGWLVRQDNPKRGLVLAIPAGTGSGELVEWLLAAAGLLSQVPLGDAWVAEVWEAAG